ncbi:MAG: hypothetical protein ABSH53_09140 [Holophaga sp.]
MRVIRGTLVCEGSSDQMIIPILKWLFGSHGFPAVEVARPDLGLLRNPPKTLEERVQAALSNNPCDIVFIHRDADACSYATRADEIDRGLRDLGLSVPHVRVVPVRMSEAWLLIDEDAIRRVAQRPNGRTILAMPRLAHLESLPDPKGTLLRLLTTASELTGRRLDQFRTEARSRVHQLAEFISDYGPLRNLSAFQSLEEELVRALAAMR